MSDMEQIKTAVRNFLAQNINGAELQDSDNIFELGLVNSLFALQLVAFIEQNFDIAVEDEELDIDNFKSIDAMSNFVHGKKQASVA